VEEGITFYDAAYLRAAIERGAALVTDDERLYEVAKRRAAVLRSAEL